MNKIQPQNKSQSNQREKNALETASLTGRGTSACESYSKPGKNIANKNYINKGKYTNKGSESKFRKGF